MVSLSNNWFWPSCYCSVPKSCLWLHGLHHLRLLCSPPSPRVCSNSSFESMMPSNHLIFCHPLLLLSSIFPSMRVFSNESALRIRWPKYCSYTFSISPSSEYSGLISFRIDWFDLLVVQGTLRSLLHSLESSVVRHSIQLWHPYMTTENTIALTIWTFDHKWCLCFVICCLGWS